MPYKTMNGKLFYRVGDVIISTNNENPSKWYGGTWQLFAPGRTIVCIDSSQTEFNALKKTGGTKVHTLSINEIPSHNHSGTANSAGGHDHATVSTGWKPGANKWAPSGRLPDWGFDIPTGWGGDHNHILSINNNGRGYAHNNLQPFIVVYMWTRIA